MKKQIVAMLTLGCLLTSAIPVLAEGGMYRRGERRSERHGQREMRRGERRGYEGQTHEHRGMRY